MRIIVIAGGLSNERNVSLASGAMITSALRLRGHDVALVDYFIGEEDDVDFESLAKREIPNEWTHVGIEAPNINDIIVKRPYTSNAVIGRNIVHLCEQADVTFLALHGGAGEDGRLQAMLDLLGIPYTGSDYLSSAIAMNKDVAKSIAVSEGINTPKWKKVFIADSNTVSEQMQNTPPVVVKIPNSGSSVGVYIVKTKSELREALEKNIGKTVLIEEYIAGREIQMAFFEDRPLPSIEIVANSPFYNYASKYQKGIATEITPAGITEEQERTMGIMLMKIADAFHLYTYSRADFIIDEDGKIWFIEINSLPGMTSTSLVPQEAAAAGIDFGELCERIAINGIKRKTGLEAYS